MENNTNQKDKVYINFIDDNNNFIIYLLERNNKPLLLPKKSNNLKNVLTHFIGLESKIKFDFMNFLQNDIIETIYYNNFILCFYSSKNNIYIIYNLVYDNYFLIDVNSFWWVNDVDDVKHLLELQFEENNIIYNDDDINLIIDNCLKFWC